MVSFTNYTCPFSEHGVHDILLLSFFEFFIHIIRLLHYLSFVKDQNDKLIFCKKCTTFTHMNLTFLYILLLGNFYCGLF